MTEMTEIILKEVVGMAKVLLVDDEKDVLALLHAFVERMGYESLLAHNGAEALEVLRTEQADVMLTDIEMPFMDGWELASRVREAYPEIRIVGTSGTEKPPSGESPLDAFVRKPFNLDEFRKAIVGEGE